MSFTTSSRRICKILSSEISSSYPSSNIPRKPQSGAKSMARNPKIYARSEKESPKAAYMREKIAKISKILRSSTWEEAKQELKSLPINWDSYTVNQVLKTHPPMEKAWLFFIWAAQLDKFKHDHYTYTTMLDIFGEAGRISSMELMLKEMKEKGLKIDAATYTSAMHWFSKAGYLDKAIDLWGELKNGDFKPTVVSYTAFMKLLFDHGREKEASAVFRELIEVGLSPTCHTYTVLIEHLAGSGKFKAALQVMNEMREAEVEPDKATCNILVQKCSKFGETAAMNEVLRYMKQNSLVLRLPIFLEALESLRKTGESDHLLREVNPHFLPDREISDLDIDPDSVIINLLLCKLNFVAIDLMLKAMHAKKIELGTDLISALILTSSRNRKLTTALLAFQLSIQHKQTLHSQIYLSLLGPLLRSGHINDALKIYEQMKKEGDFLRSSLDSVLSLGLVQAGKPDIAIRLLSSSPASERDSLRYTCLIHAYIQAMEVERGMEIFAKMRKEGFHASVGTYEVLILGMEMVGRRKDADFFRKERRKLLQRNFGEGIRVPVEESLCNFFFSSE